MELPGGGHETVGSFLGNGERRSILYRVGDPCALVAWCHKFTVTTRVGIIEGAVHFDSENWRRGVEVDKYIGSTSLASLWATDGSELLSGVDGKCGCICCTYLW